MQTLSRYRDLVLPLGVIACLIVILVPLPAALMDLFLAANITVAVIVLLTTIQISTPLEFSVFPTLLLATTLSRLVLNVATTRLILTGAETEGMNAAGGVIRSFGEFVAGDRIEVGLIIFVILVLIQFVVITKGATRISEVAARFALDGMPGRQMAIDADVNAGLIDEAEAHQRREEIRSQADFYGAMDGASKFVRGDAIAGIVITVVNVIGGLYIGVFRAGMSISEAGALFTKLTIGDGLVSQVPALLISLAAGLLVTRSAQRTNLPQQFLQQLLGNTRALAIAGVFLLLMIITNLPFIPMATLGIGCIGLAFVLNRQEKQQTAQLESDQRASQVAANVPPTKQAEDYLSVDPMEVSIGLGLLSLADPARGGDLMKQIGDVRNQIAAEIGIILPKIRVRDSAALDEQGYAIRISGNTVLKSSIRPHQLLAIDTGKTTGTLDGDAAERILLGQRALWIESSQREQAAIYGYVLQSPSEVLASQLREIATIHADEILSRDATSHLIDQLRETSPTVVNELIPDVMRISEVQQVLQLLLREAVPIRQLGQILEILGDTAPQTKDANALCERVRRGLARTISSHYRDKDSVLHVVTLDAEGEDFIAESIVREDSRLLSSIPPQVAELTCERIQEAVKSLITSGHPPVLLVNPRIRSELRHITTIAMPWLKVLSFNEITSDTQIESHHMVTVANPADSIMHNHAA